MSWIFGESSSPIDDLIEKATAEQQTAENWELFIDICDFIKSDPKIIKSVLNTLKKRLNHRDPHVILLAVALLDSCWSNCGQQFRREVSSNSFINELESKAKSGVRQVGEKTRLAIRKWTENECKADESLSLIKTLHKNLLADGYSFESSEPKKNRIPISNDPNVVTSQEEEDAIAKAIALSLNDCSQGAKENGMKTHGSSSMYPTTTENGSSARNTPSAPSPSLLSIASRPLSSIAKSSCHIASDNTVYPQLPLSPTPSTLYFPTTKAKKGTLGLGCLKEEDEDSIDSQSTLNFLMPNGNSKAIRALALYDFEAAEDNELSFHTGDSIVVTDDGNANWWRGRNETSGGEGLFPSSFVTTNAAEMNAVKDSTRAVPVVAAPVARIDAEQLMQCIALLEDCDPSGAIPDPPELASIEAACRAQIPLIDNTLASVDRQSNALAMVDVAIRNVLALYDNAVQQATYQASARYAVPPGPLPPSSIPQPSLHYPSSTSIPSQPTVAPQQPMQHGGYVQQPPPQQQYMMQQQPQSIPHSLPAAPIPPPGQYAAPPPEWAAHYAAMQQQQQQMHDPVHTQPPQY